MNVTFVQPDGSEQTVEAEAGTTLMEAAVFNMIDGVVGMCGGICSCGTCHLYVEAPWLNHLPPFAEGEAELLDSFSNRKSNSRLGCQVPLAAALAGIRVGIPAEA